MAEAAPVVTVDVALDMPMLMALDYVLGSLPKVTGRVEMRRHKAVMTAVTTQCTEENNTGVQVLKPGLLKMPQEDWDSVREYCDEIIKTGFPSRLNSGMVDLDARLQEVTKIKK